MRLIRSWMEAAPDGVFLKFMADDRILCVICLFPVPSMASGRVRVYWPLDEFTAQERLDLTERMLPELMQQFFFKYNLHRIEWLLADDERQLAELAVEAGFMREGVLKQSVPYKKSYRNGILLGAVRAENPWLNYGFVNFSSLLLTVLGDADRIHGVGLLNPGETIRADFLRECAQYQGLADEEGRVKLPAELPLGWSSPIPLPNEVELGCAQLSEYVRGERRTFAGLNLDVRSGTDFQRSVWRVLRKIPFGQVRSYEEVAKMVLSETAEDAPPEEEALTKKARGLARAVGAACGANPFLLIVPCHRVLGKDGKLTGFSSGLANKAAFLDFELMGLRPL